MALQLKEVVQVVSPIKDMVKESPISIARHCLSPQVGASRECSSLVELGHGMSYLRT